MKIDKIMHFEKRNNLRFNVFGLRKLQFIPFMYHQIEVMKNSKLINLLFIGDRNSNNNYTYIKNFNRLMKIDDGNNRSNYVCQYCCRFKTTSKEGLE